MGFFGFGLAVLNLDYVVALGLASLFITIGRDNTLWLQQTRAISNV